MEVAVERKASMVLRRQKVIADRPTNQTDNHHDPTTFTVNHNLETVI